MTAHTLWGKQGFQAGIAGSEPPRTMVTETLEVSPCLSGGGREGLSEY